MWVSWEFALVWPSPLKLFKRTILSFFHHFDFATGMSNWWSVCVCLRALKRGCFFIFSHLNACVCVFQNLITCSEKNCLCTCVHFCVWYTSMWRWCAIFNLCFGCIVMCTYSSASAWKENVWTEIAYIIVRSIIKDIKPQCVVFLAWWGLHSGERVLYIPFPCSATCCWVIYGDDWALKKHLLTSATFLFFSIAFLPCCLDLLHSLLLVDHSSLMMRATVALPGVRRVSTQAVCVWWQFSASEFQEDDGSGPVRGYVQLSVLYYLCIHLLLLTMLNHVCM